MKPRYGYLISPSGSEYNNTKKIGGVDFVVNTTIEDASFVNRVGIMRHSLNGDIPAGAEVIVHHNVFRTYRDMKGRKRKSNEYFRDNAYLVDPGRVYLYKIDGKWKAANDWCFVRPIDYVQDSEILRTDKEQKHTGVVVYSNANLEVLGIKAGTKVGFTKNSEYGFDIDGEKLYRMQTNDICLIVNE
jgi:hypothetical protein